MKINSNILLLLLPVILSIPGCDPNPSVTYTSIEGFYSCKEGSVHAGYKTYIIEIDKVVSNENLYIIANFHNAGENEFLYASYRQDTLYLENQVITNLFVNGKGKVYEDFTRIELNYTTDDGVVELDYASLIER